MNREDYFSIIKKNGIATIWLDQKGEKVNTISPEMIKFFDEVFDEVSSDSEIKAVILTSAKKDFIAGADIKAFTAEKKGDFIPIIKQGHASLQKIEAMKKPVVAAIHGTCFGLGTEIILACHARVVSDDSSTKLALPEVKLGLLPGGGGTQRLPKKIGVQAALDMMLTGKNIYPFKAKKIGLVEVVCNKNKLQSVAEQVAKSLISGKKFPPVKKTILNKFLDNTGIGQSIVLKQARKMSAKLTRGNYPAIPTIIDCVQAGLKKGSKAGYDAEANGFESLMLGDVSKGLRTLFFNMTNNKKNPNADLVKNISTIGMIGGGFMGAGITEVSIQKGFNVFLKDLRMETIESVKKGIWKGLKKKLKRKSISLPDAQQQIERIVPKTSYDGFQHAELVIEAVVERMDVKKAIISELENHSNENAIFASNTSSLSLTEMSKHSKKPENFIGMHYFSPVPKMPLLEIVKTEKTADWVIASCYDVGIRQGKTCIVVNDGPGFYVNRILAPYINECLLMLEEGLPLELVDTALKDKGFPVGPIQLLDEVGLDIAAHIMAEGMENFAKERPGFSVSKGVPKMFKEGYLGKKNKKGFYKYHPKKGKRTGPNKEIYKFFEGNGDKSLTPEEIQNRAIMLMLNEAVMCLEERIISKANDGDLGAVFGIGFLPYTGGPFRYIDLLGVNTVLETMKSLEGKYGSRFAPAKMLTQMRKEGKTFHTEN